MSANTNDLQAHIASLVSKLSDETQAARASEALQLYLNQMGRFHHYSWGNIMLILFSNPDATRVAGYHTWLKLHRYVRRGEHGIPILAPCVRREDPQDPESPRKLVGFRVAYVFDISQTDGEPLPEPPDWKSPQRVVEVEQRLLDYTKRLGITVERVELRGQTQGVSHGGRIQLAPGAGTKTLVHELAHELLHFSGDRLDHVSAETEAETIAYVVSSYLGIEDLASPNYLALVGSDARVITARLDRIQRISRQIIEAIDPDNQVEEA